MTVAMLVVSSKSPEDLPNSVIIAAESLYSAADRVVTKPKVSKVFHLDMFPRTKSSSPPEALPWIALTEGKYRQRAKLDIRVVDLFPEEHVCATVILLHLLERTGRRNPRICRKETESPMCEYDESLLKALR